MNKGEMVTLKIEGVGMNGEGVARQDGYVIFVPYTLVGETVLTKIITVKKNFATANVVKVIKASSDRISPICPVYFKCGGCDLMHIHVKKHSQIKRENIINCFNKMGIPIENVEQVIKGESIYHYRNKVQLPIGEENGKIIVGYYQENSHKIVPFNNCFLQADWAEAFIEAFLSYANENNVSAYKEETHSGILKHLVLRKVGDSVSVVIVINALKLPEFNKLIDKLVKLNIKFTLHCNINTEKTNLIMTEKLEKLYGSNDIKAEALGVKFLINPLSFMQINDDISLKIYDHVCELIKKMNYPNVVEVYSGIGLLSNIIAPYCNKIDCVEIVKEAVDNAKNIAVLNGNQNKITNVCGDAGVELPKIFDALKSDISNNKIGKVIILDPPRKGCDVAVINSLLTSEADYIIYLSCNPATLARDVKALSNAFQINSATPYDMFPNTSHIEALVCLTRK